MNRVLQGKLMKSFLALVLLTAMATAAFAQAAATTTEDRLRIRNGLVRILSEQWGIDQAKFSGETYFLRDFGADSVDVMELVMAIEEDFDIQIGDAEWEKITTVDSAVELIVDKMDRWH